MTVYLISRPGNWGGGDFGVCIHISTSFLSSIYLFGFQQGHLFPNVVCFVKSSLFDYLFIGTQIPLEKQSRQIYWTSHLATFVGVFIMVNHSVY